MPGTLRRMRGSGRRPALLTEEWPMIKKLFETDGNLSGTILRVALGVVIFPHGAQKGEGFEFHILAIAIALALVIRGGGLWSADRAIAGRR